MILSAAEAVFAEHGFDGTSVDAIATQAGYNKSLLFQYFGDKLGLYTQVLKRADGEMSDLLTRLFASLLAVNDDAVVLQAHQLKSFLTAMVQALFDYLFEHPRLMRILNWEMAEGWQTFAQIASQFPPTDMVQLEPFFRKARQAGLLRSDFVAMIQLTLMVPICQVYLSYLPLYQRLLPDEDLSSASELVRTREYLVDFVVAGMMSGPSGTKTEKDA
ncbi:hypothetical protein KDI_35480 [Dictyobacter arantiisoli]|uniref:HTH tetR-type domain-containing protein n=2 Tax=Dictyobacter arantiisoli TaxID=2014874 RepID=A0A5A5TGD4_9CHLR|nr:hypothetical protein KDI_35480 [Dictyobacter arantiisoli]